MQNEQSIALLTLLVVVALLIFLFRPSKKKKQNVQIRNAKYKDSLKEIEETSSAFEYLMYKSQKNIENDTNIIKKILLLCVLISVVSALVLAAQVSKL